MVFRLEEAVAAVAAPGHAPQRVCAAVFEATRFLMYASDAMVVILAEAADPRASGGAAGPIARVVPVPGPRHVPQFELWQVWNVHEPIRSVRFNHTHKTARGAVALCIDEGRGVLLMPASAAVSALAARVPPSTADARKFGSREGDVADFGAAAGGAQANDVSFDYAKTHLHLHLPTWKETVRWKSEDRLMSDLQWVERGEDLLLIGAGEKVTIWKLVDDAVQVYLQHSFGLGIGMPSQRIRHFDVSQNGLMVATAGLHDRVLKVWALDQLTPREGSPMRLFLPHARALVAIKWSKDVHTFKNVPPRDTIAAKCEMLFTLDKNGTISIWRENLTQRRSFALWKSIDSQDFCGTNSLGTSEQTPLSGMGLATFGLVDNFWTRQVDPAVESFGDLVLGEAHMLSALCLFHYGHGSFSEARQNALFNQRMDGSAKVNNKLLGQRSGGVADTHAGETFICGNSTLKKTFSVHLLYGVHHNGDLSLFRAEFISYSVSAVLTVANVALKRPNSNASTTGRYPTDITASYVFAPSPRACGCCRVSNLIVGLQRYDSHQPSHTFWFDISSLEWCGADRENGASSFTVLVVFQRTKGSTNLKIARLRLQNIRPSSPSGRVAQGTVDYAVQECEVGDVCSSVLNAPLSLGTNQQMPADDEEARSAARKKSSSSCAAIFRGEMGISTDTLDLFRVSPSLRSAHMVHQLDCSDVEPSITHNAYDKSTRLIFVYSSGVLRGYNVQRKSSLQLKAESQAPVSSLAGNDVSSQIAEAESEMVLSCSDALSEDGVADDLQ
jgi:hypothetical protein